jgi:probable phosphoglycerate mutase
VPVIETAPLVLIRHGQTEWSKDGRHTGRTDVPLTPYGEGQARALGPALDGQRFGAVLTSPRTRARRTAELAGLAGRSAGDVVDVVDDLVEWDYGDYEGRRSVDIRMDRPGWYLWTDGVPGGESVKDVGARVDRVLARLQPLLADGGSACIVGHGHCLRVLTARWLGLPPDAGRFFGLDPATVSLLGTEHDRPIVARWNGPVG